MTDFELAELCARLALDKKAENVVILDMVGRSTVADYFVIASGMSERQVAATADFISDALKLQGKRPYSVEGMGDGRWALVDFGSVIVHVFLDHLRDHYSLETLWAEAKRIRLKDTSSPTQPSFEQNRNSAHF